MRESEDAEILRYDRQADNDAVSGRLDDAGLGRSAILARTISDGSYPATAKVFYACEILGVLGTEEEGEPGVVAAVSGSKVFARNLGGSVPPVGTEILIERIPYRWVFQYD